MRTSSLSILRLAGLFVTAAFASAQPSITILNPAVSGSTATPPQTFTSGVHQNINWQTSGTSGTVYISLNGSPFVLPDTGIYDWLPTTNGTATFSVQATDSHGTGAASYSRSITVQSAPLSLDCGTGTTCTVLNPGESPSGTSGFQGFADPTIRRDPSLPNQNDSTENKLWMAFSYASLVQGTKVVTIDLAHSVNAGISWTCDKCASNSDPLWPTTSGQDVIGNYYQNHEVMSIWPDGSGVNTTWYGAHLTYRSYVGENIYDHITGTGGIMVSQSTTGPTGLGASGTSNYFLSNTYLNNLAGLSTTPCSTWNEPTIVKNGTTIYLILQCDKPCTANCGSADGADYYMFSNTSISSSGWQLAAGPFGIAAEAAELNSNANAIAEMDLYKRPDGSWVALAVPTLGAGVSRTKYGCVATAFTFPTINNSSNVFGTVYSKLNYTSALGDNGACGYDPTSATGVLMFKQVYSIGGGVTFSLLESGLMP
jgi:hypothetical protein